MGTTDRSTAPRQRLIVTDPVTIVFGDDNEIIQIAEVPIGARIQFINYNVTEGFTDTGTDLLIIGDGTTTNLFGAAIDISAIVQGGVFGGGYQYAAADTIDARYDGQNSDATSGSLTVQVGYTVLNKASEIFEA